MQLVLLRSLSAAVRRLPCVSLTATLIAPLASAARAAAQVPPGWIVVASARDATVPPGGLHLAQPLTPGPLVPITGLNADLTGSTLIGGAQGAGSVLVRASDGALIVGEHTPMGQTVDVHVIRLNGSAVVSDELYTVSTATLGFGSIDQMAWLGDDIVVTHRAAAAPAGTGALGGMSLGLVRPSLGPPNTPGTVVPIPLTPDPQGTINAMALDRSGTCYFGKFLSATTSTLWRVAVPAGGTPTLIATLATGPILALAFDNDGTLWAGTAQTVLNGNTLYTIDVVTGVATLVPTPGLTNVNGIAVETATGALMLVEAAGAPRNVYRFAGGVPTLLSPVAGGFPTCVAVNPTLWTHGPASPGANSYAWQAAPNPGGLPIVGNAAFSLTLRSDPGTAPGQAFLSLDSARIPILGITLLLDPTTLVPWQPLPAQNLLTLPLPVPGNPALSAMHVFVQTVHLEPTGLAASDGLRIGIL